MAGASARCLVLAALLSLAFAPAAADNDVRQGDDTHEQSHTGQTPEVDINHPATLDDNQLDAYVDHLFDSYEKAPSEEAKGEVAQRLERYLDEMARREEERGEGTEPETPDEQRLAERLAESLPGSANAQALGAEAAERAGNPAAADRYLQRSLALDPGNATANSLAAKKALDAGDNAAAVKHADAALKRNPGDTRALGLRSVAKDGLGDRSGALADAKQALALKPNDKLAGGLVKLLSSKDIPRTAPAWRPGFDKAKDPGGMPAPASSVGRPPQSEGKKPAPAPRAAAFAPAGRRESAALVADAESRLTMGDYDAAARYADAAVRSGAPGPAPYVALGKANLALGKSAEAAQDETKALEKELDASLQALVQRAWAHSGMKRGAEARKDAEAALRIAPESPAARRALEAADRPQEADSAEAGKGNLPSVPDFADGIDSQSLELVRAAQARLALGDAAEAVRLADSALQLDQKNYLAYIVRAAAFRLMGRFDKAVRDATRALWLRPLATEALLTRSLSFLRLKDWRRAEADASAAIRLDPDRLEAYRQRALARKMLGDAKGAGEDAERVQVLEAGQRPPPGRHVGSAAKALAAVGGILLAAAGLFKGLKRR